MKYLIILFSVLLFNAQFFAQALSGTVLDGANNAKVEYAAVKLRNLTDSSVVTGVYTQSDGSFLIDNVQPGKYLLSVNFLAYEVLYRTVELNSQPLDLGELKLTSNVQLVDEITVRGELEMLKAGIDKKVYNVDQDLNSRGGSAEEVLSNIPSVELDQDGNVSLRGDGSVVILIDGRPVGRGQGILDAIPASTIERVEVVTNPSAKYDADGTSGIINIVLKKNKLRGFNGVVSATAGTGNDHTANLTLSYRNKRYNIFGNYAFDYYEGFRNNWGVLDRQFGSDSSNSLMQDRQGTDFKMTHSGRLGFEFYPKSNQTFGVNVNVNNTDRERTGNQLNEFTFSGGTGPTVWRRITRDPVDRFGTTANAYFKNDLADDRGSWSASATYNFSDEQNLGFYEQRDSLNFGTVLNDNPTLQELSNASSSNSGMAQWDMEYIVPKWKMRMEFGAKGMIEQENMITFSQRYDYDSMRCVADTLSNFDYTFTQQIYAVYFQLGQQMGKWGYQVGLRPELAVQDPVLVGDSKNYKKSYVNFYPSAHVKYKMREAVTWSLGYSRRIARPSAGELNPFTSYADPFNLRGGNPDLGSEFIHSFDLGFSVEKKKWSWVSSIYYRDSYNQISRIKYFDELGRSNTTYGNLEDSKSGGLEFILQFKPTSWWKNTVAWNGNYATFAGGTQNGNLSNAGTAWSLTLNSSVNFWKNTASFQLSGRYSAPRTTLQGVVYPWTYLDMAAEKRFGDSGWTLGVKLGDVFNTKGFRLELDQPSIQQTSNFKWLTRRFYLTVSYKFGKLTNLPKMSNGGGGGDDM